ncbi:MAG: transglutaminase domain-containing protein [Terriglobales bacterium]
MASAHAQKEDWLLITQHDLELKQVPGNPGADAIQLYYADFINDEEQTEFFYARIKVLNEKGKSHADVELVIPPEGSISGLKARTIQPDGKITEFTGKPFQKTVIKAKGVKVLAKSFTMPEVNVGSIIEYKYKIQWPWIITDNSWTIQHELYTVKESFRMKPYSGGLEGFENGYQVAALYSHMPNNVKPVQKGGGYELDVENMPAFESEGYMPPQEDLKPQMRFFYISMGNSTADKFWQDAGRKWNDDVEHFIGNRKEIGQASAQAIGNETDPEQKLRKLYARAQQIRNLSYERERTDVELKKEKLKSNQNVGDVLSRGTGDREDITRLFVALARAAGFDASIVRVSNRQNKFFDKGLLSRRQLDSEIAVVNQAGKDVYLDPGTMFCPYGYLRWIRTSTQGIKLDKKGGVFVMAPPATYDKSTIRRNAEMVLDRDGNLTGTITVRFEGGDALEHRLDELQTDEAGRKKDSEDELQGWLPTGAIIKLTKSEGWDASEAPLIATFSVNMPGYASTAGKRLLVPTYLFQARQMDAFKHVDRKFPVYFPYAFAESDRVSITLPPGYTLENAPQQETARLTYAAYQNLAQCDGKQLITQRILQVNGIFFRLEQYPEMKTFFGKVQAGDEQQAVLTGGSVNAQKSN